VIFRSNSQGLPDRRQQMIDETGAWLTWALDNDLDVPRIPRRRVSDGGFKQMLEHPAARAAVRHWWMRTLGIVHNVSERFGL